MAATGGEEPVRSNNTGTVLIFLAILCLSVVPPLVRVGLTEDVNPIPLLAIRMLIAAVVLWVVFGLANRQVMRIDRRGLMACALVALSDTFASMCYYYAFTNISTSIAHVVFSVYPVMTISLLAIRGERFTKLQIIGLALALTGVFLLVGPGGHVSFAGVLQALGAAFGYAGTLTFTQWFLRDYDPRTGALYVLTFMTVLMAFISFVQWQPLETISTTGWVVIVLTAIVSTAIARLLLYAGIRRAGSGTAALLAPAETMLVVSWALLFLRDRLSAGQWGGGLLVVASMYLVMRRQAGPTISMRKLASRWR